MTQPSTLMIYAVVAGFGICALGLLSLIEFYRMRKKLDRSTMGVYAILSLIILFVIYHETHNLKLAYQFRDSIGASRFYFEKNGTQTNLTEEVNGLLREELASNSSLRSRKGISLSDGMSVYLDHQGIKYKLYFHEIAGEFVFDVDAFEPSESGIRSHILSCKLNNRTRADLLYKKLKNLLKAP